MWRPSQGMMAPAAAAAVEPIAPVMVEYVIPPAGSLPGIHMQGADGHGRHSTLLNPQAPRANNLAAAGDGLDPVYGEPLLAASPDVPPQFKTDVLDFKRGCGVGWRSLYRPGRPDLYKHSEPGDILTHNNPLPVIPRAPA